ncbi:hypothetical protein SB48_HM08orf00175 [Heyndrickxia coagulans]|uniref:Uncharacterized protein n=1 Tax=Heyndrickxia coagulans TaxID=1398 RepID=A0AAN0T358_HEYCO|nr:hypothetical protein SB48_HM08orf00175 [Heyndrickxia coagulans]
MYNLANLLSARKNIRKKRRDTIFRGLSAFNVYSPLLQSILQGG